MPRSSETGDLAQTGYVGIRTTNLPQWSQLVSEQFLYLDCVPLDDTPFRVEALATELGSGTVSEVATSCHSMRRTEQHTHADAPRFKVLWQIEGQTRVSQAGHESILQPGGWVVYDTTRAYVVDILSPSRYLGILLPQADCYGWRDGLFDRCGLSFASVGTPRVVLSALRGLLSDRTPLDESSQKILQDSVVMLIDLALKGASVQPAVADESVAEPVHAIARYIRAHCREPELTPQHVAQAFGISRRTLYNLFVAAGHAPAAFIQTARLDLARRMLEDRERSSVPVTTIAFDCGFADVSHFSRAFRRRFGSCPTEWRGRLGH